MSSRKHTTKGRAPITESSSVKEEESVSNSRIVSKTLSTVADVGSMLTVVPYIGEVASVASPVLKSVSKFAETMGFDKPVSHSSPEYRKLITSDCLAWCEGGEVTRRLAISPETQVSHDFTDVDLKDYCKFDNYKLLPALVHRFTVDTDDSVGDILTELPVCPWYANTAVIGSNIVANFNFSNMLSSRFMYWRGSMKYYFVFVTQAFVSARIRITFFPSVHHSDPNPSTLAGNYYSQIVDIVGTTTHAVSIPYLKDVKYMMTQSPLLSRLALSTSVNANTLTHNCVMGKLVISVVNPPAAPSAVPYIDTFVYSSCGEDMVFHVPTSLMGGNWLIEYPDALEEKKPTVRPLGDVVDPLCPRIVFENVFSPIADAKVVTEHRINFGDYINDWRTYFHRYRPSFWNYNLSSKLAIRQTFSSTATDASFRMNQGDYLINDTVLSSNTSWNCCLDLQQFNTSFQFRRGSRRYAINFVPASANEDSVASFYWERQINLPWFGSLDLTNQREDATWFSGGSGVVAQSVRDRPFVEVEIPFYSAVNTFCESLFLRDVEEIPEAILRIRGSAAPTSNWLVNNAIGDDFNWFYPKCPMMNSYSPVPVVPAEEIKAKGDEDGDMLSGINNPPVGEKQELTTLHDITENDTCEETAMRSEMTLPASYEKAEISNIVGRWYQYTYMWDSSQGINHKLFVFDFPNDLFATQPFITEKINNFQWIRCRFRLSIRVNATKMHAGMLLVSWIPHYAVRDLNRGTGRYMKSKSGHEFLDVFNASMNPHKLIDAGNNTSVEIDMPFATPAEFMNVAHLADAAERGWFGHVEAQVLSPLRNLEGTATSIYVTVGVQMFDVELQGPTVSL